MKSLKNIELQEENTILHEREKKLRERENMLSISQESIQTITDHQIKVKMAAIEEVYFQVFSPHIPFLKENICLH